MRRRPATTPGTRPEASTGSARPTTASPSAVAAASSGASGTRYRAPAAMAASIAPAASRAASIRTIRVGSATCGASRRPRSESRMGVRGWSRIGDSSSATPCTYRRPSRTTRPYSGYAGHTSAAGRPARSSSASVTGPMLPAGVEWKVKQTFQARTAGPARSSQSAAALARSTASATGAVRIRDPHDGLGHGHRPPGSGVAGESETRTPERRRMPATSAAPVRSSATIARAGANGSAAVTASRGERHPRRPSGARAWDRAS